MKLIDFIGSNIESVLQSYPVCDWTYEREEETDLSELRIFYLFEAAGLDFRCDSAEVVRSIFLHNDSYHGYPLCDIAFDSSRDTVLMQLGVPSKSGAGMKDPILGNFGAWDRFVDEDTTIHVEYCADADRIKKITFMDNSVVPN